MERVKGAIRKRFELSDLKASLKRKLEKFTWKAVSLQLGFWGVVYYAYLIAYHLWMEYRGKKYFLSDQPRIVDYLEDSDTMELFGCPEVNFDTMEPLFAPGITIMPD